MDVKSKVVSGKITVSDQVFKEVKGEKIEAEECEGPLKELLLKLVDIKEKTNKSLTELIEKYPDNSLNTKQNSFPLRKNSQQQNKQWNMSTKSKYLRNRRKKIRVKLIRIKTFFFHLLKNNG